IGTVMSRLARARKNLAEATGISTAPTRSAVTKGATK
ncbi:MAG: RNA polymerase sigma factor, partial [Mesorhizobium sp.]